MNPRVREHVRAREFTLSVTGYSLLCLQPFN